MNRKDLGRLEGRSEFNRDEWKVNSGLWKTKCMAQNEGETAFLQHEAGNSASVRALNFGP